MKNIVFLQLSSLEKVLLSEKPKAEELLAASVLSNERFSYQIAYFLEESSSDAVNISVNSDLEKYITVRSVENVPVDLAVLPGHCDDDYILQAPGIVPDVLSPVCNGKEKLIPYSWHSFWVTVDLDGTETPGEHTVNIIFQVGEDVYTKSLTLDVIDAMLPRQRLICTQWFHCDCIASYYGVPMLSETHWQYIDKFMATAVRNGINMILTPIFTPPLDTEVGKERPTVQLVGVKQTEDGYAFDFSLLHRWIALCKKNGVEYYEMAHLFTQWGAKYTPKIVATLKNGGEKRIFGWDVPATSPEYKAFLDAFLPELVAFLKEEGVADKAMFHISDEPHGEAHRQSYSAARALVKEHLKGFRLIDALSDAEFYKAGLVENPIPANDGIRPFLELDVPELWTYYCCMQGKGVSNRFIAMPSYRNRVMAEQMFKYRIRGFLQWGYNFYYSQLSRKKINPYLVNDAAGAFPAGDAFSVYPGEDGEALESLRLCVFYDGLQDLRAMELLASHIGHEAVVALIEEEAGQRIEFDSYPKSAAYILSRREKINRALRDITQR